MQPLPDLQWTSYLINSLGVVWVMTPNNRMQPGTRLSTSLKLLTVCSRQCPNGSLLATSVRGLKLLVCEALSYQCMRPSATSVWSLKLLSVWGLNLLVYEVLSYGRPERKYWSKEKWMSRCDRVRGWNQFLWIKVVYGDMMAQPNPVKIMKVAKIVLHKKEMRQKARWGVGFIEHEICKRAS